MPDDVRFEEPPYPGGPRGKCHCGGDAWMSRGCGVLVCDECSNHFGLAYCYCGWSLDGTDGRAYLIGAGECLEDY